MNFRTGDIYNNILKVVASLDEIVKDSTWISHANEKLAG